jgi:hypothetical protein
MQQGHEMRNHLGWSIQGGLYQTRLSETFSADGDPADFGRTFSPKRAAPDSRGRLQL